MTHRLAVKGPFDMDALSPRDANAQRLAKPEQQKVKTAAQLRTMKEKDHPPPPPPEVMEPPSSDRPDGVVYVAGKMLGKGGFALCYQAQSMLTRQKVALKIVKSQMPTKMEQKFQTELQIHSKMRQRNIVQFFRAFSFNSCTFLVLELCPNGSLMDMVKRRRGLTEAEVRFYTVQIAGAIKYMHSKGIIHRDLKMGNIFLDGNMDAKIGDFGLAALMVTGRDMQTIRRTTLCGTPNYIAPEILEKGKKGHDHMVDIWSLGVIVFAMLTSKPPFQSTTTDEIYRKARERDYEWPQTDRAISPEAKDLVAMMLQDADERPYPDEIVQHHFFESGYVPVSSDITPKLRELSPERAEFYTGWMSSAARAQAVDTLHSMCRDCGVGPWSENQMVHTQIWKEVAAEEKAGLTPAIPLAEGIVYRPFDEWLREQKEMLPRSGFQTLPRLHPSSSVRGDDHLLASSTLSTLSTSSTSSTSSSSSSSSTAAAAGRLASAGLMRAPPQSFAAQQRALNRPANPGTLPKRPNADRPALDPLALATIPIRPRQRETAEAERAPVQIAKGPWIERQLMAARARRPVAVREGGSSRGVVEKPTPAATVAPKVEDILPTVPASTTRQLPPASVARPAPSTESLRTSPSASASSMSTSNITTLFSNDEKPQEVMGTRPDVILERLRRLETELERALNARTMAFIDKKNPTPRHPQMVVKWVDYTSKYGLGYMLSNGSVGCMFREFPTHDEDRVAMCPPSCVLVRGADVHFQRRKDPAYQDRHQLTPMHEDIRFYELGRETGMSTATVTPEVFRIPVNDHDTAGKMKPGKNVFENRKCERVILWKCFANYMVARGRDESILVDSPEISANDHNVELVIFYQGFGDVRCWVFGDGHLQFNFPDHTKIALDPTGYWCHFWHLSTESAECLATTGTMGDTALDKRSAMTWPVQTLLNFQAKPASLRASRTTSTTRRRPEIDEELQGIPAANDFRRKIQFIRDVVREWGANGGMGNSAMDRGSRLRWTGHRDLGARNGRPEKHVWVTLGARWGDKRVATYVDPRTGELEEDVDEAAKKRSQE